MSRRLVLWISAWLEYLAHRLECWATKDDEEAW